LESQLKIFAYYLNGIFYLIALITILLGLFNLKKLGLNSIFILLTAFSMIQMIAASQIVKNFSINEKHIYVQYTIHLYILIELAIISCFFYFKIKSIKLRKWILICNGSLFVFMMILFIINDTLITKYFSFFIAIEAIFNLIGCIFMFIQIIDDETNVSLSNSPDFIITSGIFFFFSFTCPYYVIANYLKRNILFQNNLSTLNELVYILLFTSFIMAFQCKIRTSK